MTFVKIITVGSGKSVMNHGEIRLVILVRIIGILTYAPQQVRLLLFEMIINDHLTR